MVQVFRWAGHMEDYAAHKKAQMVEEVQAVHSCHTADVWAAGSGDHIPAD